MKFVLVNGRTPYPQTFCMLRLRVDQKRLSARDHDAVSLLRLRVYSLYCESVARLREDLAGEESRIAS